MAVAPALPPSAAGAAAFDDDDYRTAVCRRYRHPHSAAAAEVVACQADMAALIRLMRRGILVIFDGRVKLQGLVEVQCQPQENRAVPLEGSTKGDEA